MVICRYNILNLTRVIVLAFKHRFGLKLMVAKNGPYDRLLTNY